MSKTIHIPVMKKEAIEALNLKAGMVIVDATLGGGGYAREIYEKIMPNGKLIALDRDESAILNFKENYSEIAENVILVHSNYANLKKILAENGIEKVDGIVADLGLSSDQLENAERGFSFQEEANLDMRMDQTENLSAFHLVNKFKEEDLADIIFAFGDERQSRKIAREIIKNRPIQSTIQLAEIIKKSIPTNFKSKIHPATKTFQAIRIFVNKELESLKVFLTEGIDLLKSGGRMVIVSFHSGEDRIVKNCFRTNARGCICPDDLPICRCNHEALVKILTKKPVRPTEEEVENNPRSRSAVFRAVEKI